jgi:hypothetical protein
MHGFDTEFYEGRSLCIWTDILEYGALICYEEDKNPRVFTWKLRLPLLPVTEWTLVTASPARSFSCQGSHSCTWADLSPPPPHIPHQAEHEADGHRQVVLSLLKKTSRKRFISNKWARFVELARVLAEKCRLSRGSWTFWLLTEQCHHLA